MLIPGRWELEEKPEQGISAAPVGRMLHTIGTIGDLMPKI